MIKDLSFLKEFKNEVISDLSKLFTGKAKQSKVLGKIKIAALTREDYADRPEILDKYFRNNNHDLDRFHIPEISAEQYAALVGETKNPDNAKLDTATDYYIRKVRIQAVAKDLGCNPKQIDVSDYIWDERFYVTYNFYENMRMVDDWYRDHNEDDRHSITARQVMITEDPRKGVLDMEVFDNLYSFCITAIRQRKVMLLCKVEKCTAFLRSVMEYTYGFTQNPTQQMIATMNSYTKFFENLFKDKEFKEFIKSTNDIEIYGSDEMTHRDYVDTYKNIVKGLISGTDADLKDMIDLLNTVKDPYLDEILEDSSIDDHTAHQDWLLDESSDEYCIETI